MAMIAVLSVADEASGSMIYQEMVSHVAEVWSSVLLSSTTALSAHSALSALDFSFTVLTTTLVSIPLTSSLDSYRAAWSKYEAVAANLYVSPVLYPFDTAPDSVPRG